mgnify:CR=1 FL=1
MTPELQRIVDQLRDWHTRSVVADPHALVRLLGEGEAIVGHLPDQIDREQAQ